MKMTFVLPDKLYSALQNEADRRMLGIPETLRAILSERFTQSSNPGLMATKGSAEKVGPEDGGRVRKLPWTQRVAQMRAMSTSELTAYLYSIGYFPAEKTEMVLPGDLHDKRWYKYFMATGDDGQLVMYRETVNPKDPEGKEDAYRAPCFPDEGSFFNSVKKHIQEEGV